MVKMQLGIYFALLLTAVATLQAKVLDSTNQLEIEESEIEESIEDTQHEDRSLQQQQQQDWSLAPFERLISQKPDVNENYEKLGVEYLANDEVLVDGDMLMTKEDFKQRFDLGDEIFPFSKRGGARNENIYWPKGIVYYELHESVYEFSGLKRRIESAMDEYREKTCLQFIESSKAIRILIRASEGKKGYCKEQCNSRLGRKILLSNEICLGRTKCQKSHGQILHELGHAVGLYHEHQRRDRDKYIMCQFDAEMCATYFKKEDTNSRNIPYDFLSIMHYSKSTVPAKPEYQRYQNLMGQRKKLSPKDVELLNLMYRCPMNVVGSDPNAEALPRKDTWTTVQVQNKIRGQEQNPRTQKLCYYNDDKHNTLLHTAQAVCRGLDLGDAYSVHSGDAIDGDIAQLKCNKSFLQSVDYNHCRIEPRIGYCREMKVECLKNKCFKPDNVVFVPASKRYGQRCNVCVYCFQTLGQNGRIITGSVLWNPSGLWEDFIEKWKESKGNLKIRLVGGTFRYGRVEVYYNGKWGTVCDDFWESYNHGQRNANVVCRMLGFPGGGVAKGGAFYGQGSGPVWLDNVRCGGNEASIFDCPHINYDNKDCNNIDCNCGHAEDVGVYCNF